jgi:hypothetical protein
MAVIVVMLSLMCYALTIFLWWYMHRAVFFFALLAGHIGALASPLWLLLYDGTYRDNLSALTTIAGEPLLTVVVVAAAWYYTLPALVVVYLYDNRWWKPGYLNGLVTFGAFLLYHTILERVGMRLGFWSYTDSVALPFGFSNALISVIMAALISLAFLYALLLVHRHGTLSMLLTLLPALLVINLLVRGLLGAPFWVVLALNLTQEWVLLLGTVSALVLLLVAVHTVIRGLSRVDWNMA